MLDKKVISAVAVPRVPQTKPTHLAGIDALRGIASLAVCWFHMTNGYAQDSLARASGRYGWLGVEVFFVLSGFIIPYAMFMGGYTFRRDWRTFISKRILRIEPPYLLSILLVFALWHASSMIPGFKGAAPPAFFSVQTALHMGYLSGIAGYPWLNPVFWTLAIEFQFYLFVCLAFAWLSCNNRIRLLKVDILLVAISLAIDSDVLIFRYFCLFVMGIAAFQYRVRLISGKDTLVVLMLATLAAGIGHGWMVATFGILTSTLIVLDFNIGRRKLVLWLGSISYSLYLVHVPIGGRVVNFGRRYIESPSAEFILSLAALFVSLIAAYVFYLLIEKPSQQLAARLKYFRFGSDR